MASGRAGVGVEYSFLHIVIIDRTKYNPKHLQLPQTSAVDAHVLVPGAE